MSDPSPAPPTWPRNVGIRALELIFPAQYVDQADLERFDGVSAGKYTVGLGQQRMGFCSDRQDIHSLCLTVVQQLIERYAIDVRQIGRLEVGTETIIDKSKSVKSVLMQLFEAAGVSDVEGVDTTNACYGGTAALFNAVNWVESSAWDGRLALVVCADIAVYAEGPARPTGGAGAVAMLIGPDAPLVFERGLRAHHMKHAYDFYKPDFSSEYPTVDGPLSIQCYLSALDTCYQLYRRKAQAQQLAKGDASAVTVDSFDAMIFHTPFCKLVQKSVARLGVNDFVLTPAAERAERFGAELAEKFAAVELEKTYFDRDVEKAFLAQSARAYETKTRASLLLAQQVGNMYTPSVYSGLVSLLIGGAALLGKRIAVFSYGSGFAATMYSIRVTEVAEELAAITGRLAPLRELLLVGRQRVEPEEFKRLMDVRAQHIHAAPYEPSGSVEALFPGTYYLKSIDAKHRREYGRVPPQ